MIDFKEKIANLLVEQIDGIEKETVMETLEVPPNYEMGDFAFPCFKLAKIMRKSPQMIAEELSSKISSEILKNVEVKGAYLNFFINREQLVESILNEVLDKKEKYGEKNIGENKTVIVEFSSVNIAKPFHIGHLRSTKIGHALYNIYKCLGYNAIAVNHLGDYGKQFGLLITAFLRWGDKDVIEKDPIKELLKLYVRVNEAKDEDKAVDDEARLWFKKLENGDEQANELWKWMRDISLVEFQRVYDMLGIEFDAYTGESFYSDKMPAVIDEMEIKGILEESEGATVVNLEEYDMPPALIRKSDGSTLYLTRDIAAAKYRKEHYKFYKNIYVVGSEQRLHFKQWFKVLELMGNEWVKDCIHVPFGLISLEDGSMSTRKGRVVFLEDVLNQAVEKTKDIIEQKNPNLNDKELVAKQVGIGAVVFQELFNSRIKDYYFSWERTLSFEGETGPYVQYTHARAASILRKNEVEIDGKVDFSLIGDVASINLARIIGEYSDYIVEAMNKNEPSIITRYTISVAKAFNVFYHENPILSADLETKKARMHLVFATKQTLKNALALLGIEAPEQM